MFEKKLQSDPIYILLSGIPCSGKSTWRQQMLSQLSRFDIPVTVLSADDIAFRMCEQHNQQQDAGKELHYSDMMTTHRESLEHQFGHVKLNWHIETKPHPVASIYSKLQQPLVGGTDDTATFGGTAKSNFSHLLRFFDNEEGWSRKEIKAHQATMRFS